MALLLRWAALCWTCCSIFYIAFFDTTLVQLGKAFLPPLTLALLAIAFRQWDDEWYDDDDDGSRVDVEEYSKLTAPVDSTKRVVKGDFEKKRA